MNAATQYKTHILIIGGGFAGVRAARRLALHGEFQVTLISADDSFAYYPQLYHSATGGSRSESAIPLRELLGPGVHVLRDTAVAIDPTSQTVTGASGRAYRYDEVILALGSVTNYFGISGLEEFSYNIKSITGAGAFKRHLHKELIEDRRPDPNYVVVGGGPTGVELAAALGQYLRRIVRLHGLTKPSYRIRLVEAAPRLLPRSPEAVSIRVHRRLEALGVEVLTGAAVQAETADTLQINGEPITTHTVVWTAGVSNNPFFKANSAHFTFTKNGKVEVDEHLQARPHVYVLGDNAATPYSGMAQTALHDADYAAADILRGLHQRRRPAYRPKAPVSVIPVGAGWAAVQWGPVRFYGYAGFIIRRCADLIGYADVESWPKAIRLWLQDARREDDCMVCSP
jgi:NADH dehydrogenase